jgi:hypothetical protein
MKTNPQEVKIQAGVAPLQWPKTWEYIFSCDADVLLFTESKQTTSGFSGNQK